MSNGNLSGAQFGSQSTANIEPPQAHRASANPAGGGVETPLSESAGTWGTAKTHAAWRKQGVMPYSKATSGSTFNPYA